MVAVDTRLFGKIEIEDEKVITFERGMIGFPELTKFTLIYNSEKEQSNIRWLQSLEDGSMAFPIIDPICIVDEYNPMVKDDLMARLGEYDSMEDLAVVLVMRIPENIEDMSVNMKAPVVINTKNKKAVQIIVEGDYQVRQPIYKILQDRKESERIVK